MQSYRWLFGCLGAGMLVLAACAPSAPADPGYHLYQSGGAQAVATPVEFMTAAGCRAVNDHPVIGAIVIGRPASGFDLFICAGLRHDSVHALSKAYKRLLVAAKLRGEAEVAPGGDGYWELIASNLYCSDVNMNGKVGGAGTSADGTVILPTLETQSTCYSVETYEWEAGDGGGGSGSGGGDPGGDGGAPIGFPNGPPANPLPVPVSVTVTPSTSTMAVGDYSALGMVTATVTYSDGSSLTAPTAVTWSVTSGSAMLQDDDLGTFHALAPGSATITATYGQVTGSATVTVSDMCPGGNPACKLSLRTSDVAQLHAAIDSSVLRTNFTNDSIRALCAGLFHDLRVEWTQRPDSFFRGNDSIPDASGDSHDAEYYGTRHGAGSGDIHVDQDYLDARHAPGETLALLLHEIAHEFGYGHPHGYVDLGGLKLYSDSPFNVTTTGGSGNGNSCVP